MPKDGRSTIFVALLLLTVAAGLYQFNRSALGTYMYDFRAFYCGARVAVHASNPYLQEPLYSCEAHDDGAVVMHARRNIAIPTPLPGYALAVFVPLALLPFWLAAVLWSLILVISMAATIAAFRRLTRLDLWALTALVFATDGVLALAYGQVVPIAVCGLATCASALERKQAGLAVTSSFLLALQPQIALPVLSALLLWHRRTRFGLLGLGAVLAVISIAFLGAQTTLQYLTSVLPNHALSELYNPEQLGLSPALAQSGVNIRVALAAGTAQYLFLTIVAVATAGAVAQAYRRRSMLVFWPAALVLVGGSYQHIHQIAFAVPLALVSFVTLRHPLAKVASLLVLAVPWGAVIIQPDLLPVAALAVFLLAVRCGRLPMLSALGTVAALIVIVVGAHGLTTRGSNIDWSRLPAYVSVPPKDLAEESWRHAMNAYVYHDIGEWIARGATWGSVAFACVLAACAVVRRERPLRIAAAERYTSQRLGSGRRR